MPRAKPKKNASGLSVHLEKDAAFYTPGSVLRGIVELNTAADLALGEVTICFYGREKVRFVQHHGQGESHWRGRAPLFEETLVLYEGIHTHKPGSFSWPFQFTIPEHPDEAGLQGKQHPWKTKDHFASIDDGTARQGLPPTFNFRRWAFGYRYHAFVEYVLETSMKEPNGTHHVLPSKSRTSVLPIIMRPMALEDNITRPLPGIEFSVPSVNEEKPSELHQSSPKYPLRSRTTTHTVRTTRLDSGDRNEQSSLKQKASSIFSPSRLPTFSFAATVSTPDTIELLDTKGVPFLVKFNSIAEESSISPNMYPKIRIDSLSISIQAITYIRFRGLARVRYEDTTSEVKLLDRVPVNYEYDLRDMVMAGDQTDSQIDHSLTDASATASPGIDLTKIPGLTTILSSAKFGRGRRITIESPLAPTFQGYIVSREYDLKWRLDLDVLGEKIKVESESENTVIVTEADVETLRAYLRETNTGSSGVGDAEDDDDDDDLSISDEDEDGGSKGLSKKMGNLLSSRRKTKAEEAAEENEIEEASGLPQYEQVGSNSIPTRRQEDQLPKYES